MDALREDVDGARMASMHLKVGFSELGIIKSLRSATKTYLSIAKDKNVVGDLQHLVYLLLHDQYCYAGIAADLLDVPHHTRYNGRGEAQGRLVQQQKARRRDQSIGEGKHLLLAAGKCSGPLAQAGPKTRKPVQGPLDACFQSTTIWASDSSNHKIFVNREISKDAIALGSVGDTCAQEFAWVRRLQELSIQNQLSAPNRQQTEHSLEQS